MKNPSVGDERVLILAPSGRDAVLAQRALAESRVRSMICTDTAELAAQMRIGAGTALVATEALNGDAICALTAVLAGQPEWSDFGLIILTRPHRNGAGHRQLMRQLSALPSAPLLERPLRASTLISSVETMLRSRRRQYELRSHLLERERLKHELEAEYDKQHRIAETLQLSLLSPPRGRLHPLLETATIYRAASEEADLGGDFYDQFLIDGSRIALVVGDVSGKGLHAAARTMEVKHPLRAFLRETGSPAEALARLNRFLITSHHLDGIADAGFICLFACVVDAKRRTVSFANAGIEPPILYRNSRDAEELSGSGPPLGVELDAEMDGATRDMEPGDTLIILTDGIIEARRLGMFFGREGLIEAIVSNSGAELPVMLDQIVESAVRFAGGRLLDDACVLGARLLEPSAAAQ